MNPAFGQGQAGQRRLRVHIMYCQGVSGFYVPDNAQMRADGATLTSQR